MLRHLALLVLVAGPMALGPFDPYIVDYQISRPQFLFLKLAESQEVRVSGVAVAAP